MRREARFGRLKRWGVAALCAPWVGRLVGRATGDRIPSRGAVIDVRGLGLRPVHKAQLFWGLYESAEVRFVRHHLRSDLDTIELGSGVGAVSVEIARRLDAGRRLLCVEANPDLCGALRRTLAANRAACEAEAVPAALSYGGSDVAAFEISAWHLGSRLATEAGGEGAHRVEVPAVTLERLWRERLAGAEFQLVADVEGAEGAVFEHETRALAACRGLVIECHPTTIAGRPRGVEALIDKILAHDFELADRYGPVCFFTRAPCPAD